MMWRASVVHVWLAIMLASTSALHGEPEEECLLQSYKSPCWERYKTAFVGSVVGQVVQVSQEQPQIPGAEVRTALCFSGGGNRAMAAAMGSYRALADAGLMEKVDLISSVSGGTWASSIYMFSQIENRKLLGALSVPHQLDLSMLGSVPPKMVTGAMSDLGTALAISILAELRQNTSINAVLSKAWPDTIARLYLAPLELGNLSSYMAQDAQAVNRIKAENTALAEREFLVPNPASDRPSSFVMNGILLAPVGYFANGANVVGLRMSPNYAGSPFYPNGSTVDYFPRLSESGPPLLGALVGGGMVESFAFGSPVLAAEAGQLRVEVQERPLSLAKAAAISSAAYAAAADFSFVEDKLGPISYKLLKKFLDLFPTFPPLEADPEVVYWPVTSEQFPDPGPAANMTYQLGDGGNIENDGVISALQNGATNLAVFVNTMIGLPADVNWCGVINQTALQQHIIEDNDPFSLFGFETDAATYHYVNNQVFPKSAMQPLFCELFTLYQTGKPMVAMQEVTLVNNTWWGIQGGRNVTILWNRLGVVRDFEKELPLETQEQLLQRNNTGSTFACYPYYPTASSLTAAKINLLAAQTQYAVQENYDKFVELLGP